eukprot:139972-Lingulodinium_polyedra.AAC.1
MPRVPRRPASPAYQEAKQAVWICLAPGVQWKLPFQPLSCVGSHRSGGRDRSARLITRWRHARGRRRCGSL